MSEEFGLRVTYVLCEALQAHGERYTTLEHGDDTLRCVLGALLCLVQLDEQWRQVCRDCVCVWVSRSCVNRSFPAGANFGCRCGSPGHSGRVPVRTNMQRA